ncbi:hypothetical protein [Sphaerobacter thermophilus]|jgi:hypothetical protein|uniref:Uncharacterized protein n=1 Tax=Sphaerobacter thermophilus (strain ATCC 49802 / DSM 20745 / KCCM 41009 / NCIMB 13125 / S 6022) TaxID=479434 RepID=D1C6Y3_SPHTD|nr:hypothetical protein [Sphaerobacter thermophilus]ACZ37744.1 hypothetical protein Sthe_0305 [Sphaerobacter thermophilus DSM 20745]PZN66084.1 MAG: hypothetical protein DIU58_06060 [Sphaerobacter thermophilus]
MVTAALAIPDDLLAALEAGELTTDQLRRLIELEANRLGMTFDEAVERARQDRLPRTPQGFDLQFHILMLDA